MNNFKCLDIREDENITNDSTSVEMNSGIWWRHLVAGGIAGVVSRTCTAPLDRLKVFLQVHSNVSIIKCFQGMLKEGGVIGLWRGNGINVLKIAPESAVKFMTYEQAKRAIKNYSNRDLSISERFMAGSVAGGVSQTAIYPLETLRTRLALRKTGEYSGIFDAAKKIYRGEGLRSYYRGYVPNILGIIPYAGIDLAVYETLKNNYIHRDLNAGNPGVLLLIGCGIASSTCGQIVCYPLALVRTRLQAQAILTSPEHAQSMTMTGVIRNIIAREGFIGLYHGFTPNLMKVFPAVSISYVVYERMRQTLGVKMT